MEFCIAQEGLVSCLEHVKGIVDKRNSIPILANVKISAKGDTVSFSATDLDIYVTENRKAEVKKEGEVTVCVQRLYDVARHLAQDEKIHFSWSGDKDQVTLVAGEGNFNLPALSVTSFPTFAKEDQGTEIVLTSSALLKIFNKTKHAVSVTQEGRYYLQGTYLHLVKEEEKFFLNAAATDLHRLVHISIALEENKSLPDIIVPRKTVLEMSTLLEDLPGGIKIKISENKVAFEFANIYFVSRIIDAKFPDYQVVIPKDNSYSAELSLGELKKAVDLVTSVSVDKTKIVTFNFSKDKLTLYSTSEIQGIAEGEEKIDVNFQGNEEVTLSVNAKYLVDVLSCIEGEKLEFKFKNDKSPIVVKDQGDISTDYILMPVEN